MARYVRPLTRSQNSSKVAVASRSRTFHSSLYDATIIRSDSTSSLRDPELDPSNWGYRVVAPGSNINNRTFTSSSVTSFSTREDYDDYTLHVAPMEGAHCDLGATSATVGTPTSEVETLLQFDETGLVRPVWETIGVDGDSSESYSQDEGTAANMRYQHVVTDAGSVNSVITEPKSL